MIDFQSTDMIVFSTATAVFLLAVVFWQAIVVPWGTNRRLQDIANRRQHLINNRKLGPFSHRPQLGDLSMGLMRKITERLNLLTSDVADEAREKLAQAGWRSRDALVVYLFSRFSLPFVLGGLALLAGQYGAGAEDDIVDVMIFALPPVILGAYLPALPVRNAIQKRQKKILNTLPDSLDLLVVCAQAGLSLDASLERVSNEMEQGAAELSDELRLTVMELGYLPERRKALENLIKRTGVAQVESVVNTLLQTERYGTPLAQSLRVLAAEYRSQRLMKAEEKAARLPAIMTIPMIIFILPVLFVVLLGPAIIGAMDAFAG